MISGEDDLLALVEKYQYSWFLCVCMVVRSQEVKTQKISQASGTPQGRQHTLTLANLLIPVHGEGSFVQGWGKGGSPFWGFWGEGGRGGG
jgi:hypothetical protein